MDANGQMGPDSDSFVRDVRQLAVASAGVADGETIGGFLNRLPVELNDERSVA